MLEKKKLKEPTKNIEIYVLTSAFIQNWMNGNIGKSMNGLAKKNKLKPNNTKTNKYWWKKIRNENLSWAEMWFEYKLSVHDFLALCKV